jgi:hypothetical protein
METPQEFLARTSSAVRHLFAGIDTYLLILRSARPPVLVGSYTSAEERETSIQQWAADKHEEIQKSLEAERRFLSQKYALAALSGSVLQIASMAIRLYSTNELVPADFVGIIKPGSVPAAYCIGRRIRGVPIALVIYAGRNQYNHVDDDDLREPNLTVFERLAVNHGYGDGIRDPAFDLRTRLVWNYASNVISLVGWTGYESYESDMRSLLA